MSLCSFDVSVACGQVQMSLWLLEEKGHVTMQEQFRIVSECRERLEVEAAGFRLHLSRLFLSFSLSLSVTLSPSLPRICLAVRTYEHACAYAYSYGFE